MSKQFSKKERVDILGRLLPLAQSYDRLASDIDLYGDDEQANPELNPLEEQLIVMNNEIQELLESYMKGLPIRDLSRCPFTGEKVSMAIDDMGLDGLWWNYDSPKRPENKLPDTWFAIDGALMLKGEIEKAPFLCSPGPDIPFVLPRLLEFIQAKAVISTIQIGSHIAYPICYYADPMLYGELRVNDWGTGRYWETGSMIPELWSPGQYISLTPDKDEYDFDLEPWIKAGKLLWISPDDNSMTLHGHVSGCPYLNLQGSRRLKFIRDGLVWEDEEELEFFDEDNPDFDLEHFQSILKQIEEEIIDE
ncbi:MAG: hypothetical protein GX129_08845 [Clostridiales bacterium]|jgi:hypothetical protein|nr:hypothetical protein [Clostridiales bacterium]